MKTKMKHMGTRGVTGPDPMAPAWLPLVLTLGWLGGTFLLFIAVGEVSAVPNMMELSAFVTATLVAFALGYRAKTKQYRPSPSWPVTSISQREVLQVRRLTAIGAAYFAAYGLAQLSSYGLANLGAVKAALLNPGGAYLAKFDVYASQEALGTTSLPTQILTIGAVAGAPLVPFLVVYFRHLTTTVKIMAVVGLSVYIVFFLSIGTMSGLGFVLVPAGVASLVLRARRAASSGGGRRRSTALMVVAVIAFVAYMTYSQTSRIDEVGTADRYQPNPVLKAAVGDDLARGFTVVLFYPTHGYQGLAYNLDTPFEWTGGRGSALALDSYLDQYGFGDNRYLDTYPARTETLTGWPAGRYWATIYPWLASDITFPGTILFMGVLGWWFARFWHEACVLGSRISLLMFCQIGLLIVYIPANNQIGQGRPALITFVCLLAAYVLSKGGRKSLRFRPGDQAAAGMSPDITRIPSP